MNVDTPQITGSIIMPSFSTNPLPVWTTGTSTGTNRTVASGAGTSSTSALVIGGVFSPLTAQKYDGTSWSNTSALIYYMAYSGGAGTQNDVLAFGGGTAPGPPNQTNTQAYNGTSWTAGGAMITGRCLMGTAGASSNSVLAADGTISTSYTPVSEAYNGTTWASRSNLTYCRSAPTGTGTQNAALVWSGVAFPGLVTCSEKYNGTSWSTAAGMITNRQYIASGGTQNAAIGFGGNFPSGTTCTETYDGTSWSVSAAMITAVYQHAGAGTQTSALSAGNGSSPYTTVQAYCQLVPLKQGYLWLDITTGKMTFTSGSSAATASIGC